MAQPAASRRLAAAFEFLRIVARQGAVYYVAQPGGRAPTEFRQTSGDPGTR